MSVVAWTAAALQTAERWPAWQASGRPGAFATDLRQALVQPVHVHAGRRGLDELEQVLGPGLARAVAGVAPVRGRVFLRGDGPWALPVARAAARLERGGGGWTLRVSFHLI